ncbi:DUF2510 domain-containing protein [Patulibacter sp. NPDC049589]|uniref:DUF2510 domain-containing protein n=1 Tax=Patulibacter sp. NPDC049589 TaxID=3154731 RepID=UPI003434BD8F
MSARTSQLTVASPAELENAITSYIVQGYAVEQRTGGGATLRRPKQLNVPIVVISAVLCIIPLVIYLIVYALQSDDVVILTVAGAGGAPDAAGTPTASASGAAAALPAAAVPEGWYPDPGDPSRNRWWDGSTWTEHVG